MMNTYLSTADNSSAPKRSLVIAGGGMRVAYQAGVLKALHEAGLGFEHADGTSGGTINLAMLLSGLSPDEMCDRWRTLSVGDFVSLMPLQEYLNALDMLAMGDADGIVDKVFPHLGIDISKINQAQGLAGTFNVCNYSRKTNQAISQDKLTLDLLVAGISLPLFMPPVQVDNQLYMDSVWIKDANLMEAVKRGAEEIWLIWCIGNIPDYHRGAFNQYVHMIELSANGGLFEEFDRIKEINKGIAAGQSLYGQRQPIRLHVIKPEFALPLDPDLYLGHIDTTTLISMGYQDGKSYLTELPSEGVAFEPEATQMRESQTLGINFRETMSGNFSLGATEPDKGAEKGKIDKTELAMHASIFIRDLDGFVADPDHQGEIHGCIDFAPLGIGLPTYSGRFNLFSPTEDPDLKIMVYELGFTVAGQSYYLAGRKNIKDDPGFDLWTDTTTLFTTLHLGKDASAPVVGAGILTLGIKELTKLVASMNVSNADNLKHKLSAYTKFGQFFMGELWDSYAKFVSNRD
ncbi:patatin-like phospholipase family protein [Neptunicella sp. SCSIO 80796]|uniref:patatin-like phospholipase family protein n=1 Tax=Neptunicella plasticusilytica TaxID=3117012 RepID=UPI003A4D86F3